MSRFVALIALAGCGRVGFDVATTGNGDSGADTTTDVVPLGHDEDGDGIPDALDVCPHLAGPQSDADSDGVGDDCDPNPASNRDRIALFATMGPGDQPLITGTDDASAVFTQLPDALRFDGTLGSDNNLFGHLEMPLVLGDVRIAVGFDILAVVPGSTNDQNQIALAFHAGPPLYFIELNQIPGMYANAEITFFDGTTYTQAGSQALASGIHTGPVFMQTTQRVGGGIRGDISWPGEPYGGDVVTTVYQGGNVLEMNLNNVHLELRWLVVITST